MSVRDYPTLTARELTHFEAMRQWNFWAWSPNHVPTNDMARRNAEQCQLCRRVYNAMAALCGADEVTL